MSFTIQQKPELEKPSGFITKPSEFIVRRIAELTESDPQFRAALPKPEINEAKLRKDYCLAQILEKVMEGYADRPALAMRATELVTDAAIGRSTRRLLDHFEAITYRQLWDRARAVAAYWHHEPGRTMQADDLMCIIAFAGTDFATLDVAAFHSGIVTVPLQTNGQMDQLLGIVREVEPRWLCTSLECLETAADLVLNGHKPVGVLVFDYHPEVDDERETFEKERQKLAAVGLPDLLITLPEAIGKGKSFPAAPLFDRPDSDNRLSTIFYTSGSTGLPKGAMYPEKMNKFQWRGVSPIPFIYMHYAPMNHALGRVGLFSTLCAGGTCYFTTKSDLSELFEDIKRVRPTYMGFVPRICEMVYQHYQVEFERRVSGVTDVAALKQEIILECRNQLLGGRILGASIGSAPLSPELREFMHECLGYQMADGYGSTEIGGALINNRIMRPPITEFKLDDVPELGYYKTDKPYPRGEFWIKSTCMMLGYYKRPEVTASVMSEDGYYKTGDIMTQIEPEQFTYLDRRNNVTKLAQGEFVAIARVESLLINGHPLIRQAYLYGTSARSYLLGVFVASEEALQEAGIALDDSVAIKNALREAIKQVARKEDLRPYEVPRDFIVEREPFSTENGLLAGIGKYQRPRFKERYGPLIEKMYDAIAASQSNELAALRRDGRNAPVLEAVVRAMQATLGLERIDATKRASFAELGGDSLSALSCSILLEEIYDIEVPAGVINNPAGSLQQIAQYIERARAGFKRPTFASVHGKGATQIRAADLMLEKFIDAETLAAGHKAAPPVSRPEDVRSVLVTGANGFLGRFLCLEWLERMVRVGGKVVCIARGRDDAAARARIAEVFDSGDAGLRHHFEELAAKHLEVLAGDLAEPDLGLRAADWKRLSETLDLIVHPAALVNHVLPYQSLFGPNAVGTAELIRLAITHRQKPIVNVSTVAAAMLPDGGVLDEDADVRTAMTVRPVDTGGYAEGYAHSKWAGEVLLREAHDRYQLPVSVFRSDMILPHSKYKGQINITDMFTRWLMSVVLTGLAPKSFYSGDASIAHYDGLPGNFTAEAVSTLGVNALSGYRTYHVVNPHDDRISMDTFIDWAIEAGYKIERIADYNDWASRFETALRALPEKQRHHSSLPLIHQTKTPMPAMSGAHASSVRFRADVKKYGVGPDKDIPHLSAPFIRKYLDDLRVTGLL